MDENWPLFTASIAGRAPTAHEAQLLDASRRLWPAALAAVKKETSDQPGLPLDPKSIATECWEKSLFSARGTMNKLGTANISNLDSYLFGIFSHRLRRYLAEEHKKRQAIEFVPDTETLTNVAAAKDLSAAEKLESRIALREALERSDEWFEEMAVCYLVDMSWKDIGRLFGLTKEKARKRFEYGIRKLRKSLQKPSDPASDPKGSRSKG